jgi:hypothetical protein
MGQLQRNVRAVAMLWSVAGCNAILGNEPATIEPENPAVESDASSDGSDAGDAPGIDDAGTRADGDTGVLPPPVCSTCSELHLACGMASDGCGNTLGCGVCPKGQICQTGQCAAHPSCGNGVCDSDEACGTCPSDCTCADGGLPLLVRGGIATIAQAPGTASLQIVNAHLSVESGWTCAGNVCLRGGIAR